MSSGEDEELKRLVGHRWPSSPARQEALRRVMEKAKVHKAMYPTFEIERYLEYVLTHNQSCVFWAAKQSTARVNKGLHKQISWNKLGERD